MFMRKPLRSRKPAIIVACTLLVMLTTTVVITAIAAPNSGSAAKPTVLRSISILSPEKQTAVSPQETKLAEYATLHPEAARIAPTETSSPLPLGIQSKYPNWWNMKQRVENEWYGNLNGERVSVYAGVCPTFLGGEAVYDPQQGCIGVAVGSRSVADADYHEYLTPRKSGAVRITAVNGTQVSLVAKDGTTFSFDLTTRTFS